LSAARHRYEIDIAPPSDLANTAQILSRLLVAPDPSSGDSRWLLRSGIPVEINNGMLSAATSDAGDIQEMLDALRQAGATIRRVQAVRPSLEELFMEAVARPNETSGDIVKGSATL
jgi:hypothetical protein